MAHGSGSGTTNPTITKTIIDCSLILDRNAAVACEAANTVDRESAVVTVEWNDRTVD